MKQRLDQLLVQRGLSESRSKAQSLIKAGLVLVDGVAATKSGLEVDAEALIEVQGEVHPWVSRGGMKLAHALAEFRIEVQGLVALDVGASTGGFTDVLLTNGARKVYAVDVGTEQLHPRLRLDANVVSLEQTNARELTRAQIPEALDLIVCDASFIALHKVLAAALELAKPDAQLVTLIKPQFELGKEAAAKGEGVIRDPAQRRAACDGVMQWLEGAGWQVLGLTESPITGPKGNVEFLLYARRVRQG